jgi:hypothetical protein
VISGEPVGEAVDDQIVIRSMVAKLDVNGNHLWSKSFGTPYADYVLSVTADGSENALMSRHFNNSVDFWRWTVTTIGFDIPVRASVRLRIYGVSSQLL